ncbi:MAG TPA: hypothetical protein VGG38_12330 [Acidimicrobiales bacterium]
MDEYQRLRQAGTVPEPPSDVLARAEQILREYVAAQDKAEVPHSRRRVLVVSGVVATAAAVVALGVSLSIGNGPQTPTIGRANQPSRPPVHLKTQTVVLISSESSAAVANSGTAVETTSNSISGTAPSTPQTIDVTFSGNNVNYLIASNGDGAEGVQNRVVDGQFYLYIKGPDLKMHWYHDTGANAAASESFPDPRTLLEAINPSAQLENLGTESVNGVELTHLRATDPAAINNMHIADVGSTVTAFDAWVDSSDVVKQMQITSSAGSAPGNILCESARVASGPTSTDPRAVPIPPADRVSTLPGGKAIPNGTICGSVPSYQLSQLSTTLDIQFDNLGAPESVTAPASAINQVGLG